MDRASQLVGQHRIDHAVALDAGPALKSIGDDDYIEVRFTRVRQPRNPGVTRMFMRFIMNFEGNGRKRVKQFFPHPAFYLH